jgi:Protein of unknown function (DUF3624)
MSCEGCGTSELDKKLGKCASCMWLALVSSVFFWSVYYVAHGFTKSRLILLPVKLFASLVTLLLVSHVLAFLSNRRRQPTGDPPAASAE